MIVSHYCASTSDEDGILQSRKVSTKNLWAPLQLQDSMILRAKGPVPLVPGNLVLCTLYFLSWNLRNNADWEHKTNLIFFLFLHLTELEFSTNLQCLLHHGSLLNSAEMFHFSTANEMIHVAETEQQGWMVSCTLHILGLGISFCTCLDEFLQRFLQIWLKETCTVRVLLPRP